MRLIDADALISEIKKDTEKAIEQDDKVGSFWLGYIAGLVIKQPTIQSALDPETLIRTIETGITATNSSDVYSLGMRNGMRWCRSLIDGVEPKFEEMSVDNGKDLPSIQPEKAQLSKEGTTSDTISRQAAIDALQKCQKHCIDPFDSYHIDIQDAENQLSKLPTVQPEPKEGKWVYGEDSTADCVDGYRCSQCGFFVPWDYNHKFIDYINDYAYCPNCGARMKGERQK